MCTDVTWFHAHRCFPLRWVNLGRPRNFPSKISLSSINSIKKIFSWTNRNRPFLFHSLMTNSSIVVINVVSKPCLCPPGCIEAFFVVLDFIHCLFHVWKGQEAVNSRMCCLWSLWRLCRTRSVLTQLGHCLVYFLFLKSVFIELVFPSSPSFGHMRFLNQPVVSVVLNCLSSISLTNQMMEVQGVVRWNSRTGQHSEAVD